MVRYVPRHKAGAKFARIKGADLFEHCANLGALIVGQSGQVYRTGHVVEAVFRRAAYVDHGIKAMVEQGRASC